MTQQMNEWIDCLQRLYPDWSYNQCKELVEDVMACFGKEIENFEKLNYKQQENIVNMLMAVLEFG